MAKEKKEKKEQKPKFPDDPVSSMVVHKWGNIIESGEKVLASLKQLKNLSLSPSLDVALGGGLREGSIVIMTGDQKTGKTTTSMHFIAKCQKLGRPIIFVNTEDKMTKENFEGIKGLDPGKIMLMQPTEECPVISAEKYLNAIEMYVKNTPNAIIVVDSLSNMVPQCELDGDISGDIRNKLPKMLSIFLKRIGPEVRRNRSVVICITHNITNTSGAKWAPKKMSDCGTQLQYQAGTNMIITHRGKLLNPGEKKEKEDEGGDDDGKKSSGPEKGQIAYWRIKTSAAGGRPGATATSYIRYGTGIDEVMEIAHIATELNFIRKNSSWYNLDVLTQNKNESVVKKYLKSKEIDEKDDEAVTGAFRFQGMQNVVDFLNENEPIVNFIYGKVKELI